ncbi:hypothetical protein [Paludisphaera borealis]|uniref:Uncharacterized protein n=1 Tax=Paludisphaera borealis TaxID=1387353 RepID=A0A1U7CUJ5_9BACT|nr:hypothetical protein [Paludisphaera borealis]APW62617.1 hypothetical protein BSF38_04167 [Paludisphaera borealis]
MELARGVHVEDWDGEHEASNQARQPADDLRRRFHRPLSDDVVGLVDRLQQPLKMRRGERLDGRAEQDDRLGDGFEGVVDQVLEPGVCSIDWDDQGLHRSMIASQPFGAGSEDGGRRLRVGVRVGEQDQAHAGPLERLTVEVRLERVERVGRLGRRH